MKRNPRVYLEIQIGNRHVGRIIIELFADLVPKTAENFRGLCTGEYGKGQESQKVLSYMGCKIFRIVPGQLIQTGDFVHNDGTGGESVYGGGFADENFSLWHAHAGVVSMASASPDDNRSQIHITLKKTAHLNRRYVVFGQVRAGMEILRAIERLPTDPKDRPRVPVIIVGSGMLKGPLRPPKPRAALVPLPDGTLGYEETPAESAATQGRKLLSFLLTESSEGLKWKDFISQNKSASIAEDALKKALEEDDIEEESVPVMTMSGPDYDVTEAQRILTMATAGVLPEQHGVPENDDLLAHFAELQKKLNHGRRLNHRVLLSEKKEVDLVEKLLRPKLGKPGWSDDPKWYLSETAMDCERRLVRKAKKISEFSTGFDVYNLRSVYKTHSKR